MAIIEIIIVIGMNAVQSSPVFPPPISANDEQIKKMTPKPKKLDLFSRQVSHPVERENKFAQSVQEYRLLQQSFLGKN